MEFFRKRLRNSWFFVNKIYLFLLFLVLSFISFTTFMYFLLFYFIIFVYRLFTRRIPLEPREKYEYETYVYKESNGAKLKMDIWYPKVEKTKYPVVLFAHGGGWISGFRNQPNNVSWCKFLASNGLVAASIDYRFGVKNTMTDILSDYTDALNYLRQNSEKLKIDKSRIILMGLSAGGHLALLYSAYYSFNNAKEYMKGIKGVVVYYAPSDLKDIFSDDSKSLFAKFATLATLKGSPQKIEDIYEYYSPISWISERMPPILVVHGKNDLVVPFSSSVKLVKKLKEKGVKYMFLVHKTGGHTFEFELKDFQTVRIIEKTVKFIKELTKE